MIDREALVSRFPRLDAWESGDALPTLKQVEAFARATHTPVGFFFLPAPPEEHLPIPDFRTMRDRAIRRLSPDLLDVIHLCQQRQEWYRGFARSVGEKDIGFVGSASLQSDPVTTAAEMRHALQFDLEERRSCPSWADALRRFIAVADTAGVLVMVSGVVGSNNHRKLDPDEFRGFTLADRVAPLIFINGSDTKAAQMFTLAHELAHVWLGASGVSDEQPSVRSAEATERWCNAVAAELLVPLDRLSVEHDPASPLAAEMERLARVFKVSTLVILRRIFDSGRISWATFQEAYENELQSLRAVTTASGGDFYLTLGARVSKRFARAVMVDTLEGRSSYTETFRLLGFRKMSTFRELGESLGIMTR